MKTALVVLTKGAAGMSKNFIAHIREDDGAEQTIEEHCEAVRRLAESFAIDEWRSIAAYSGYIHDIGKFRDGFQARIRGTSSKPCEHACCGAQEIAKHMGNVFVPMLEYCVAGHHSGLQNGKASVLSPLGSLEDSLKRDVSDIEKYRSEFEKYCTPPDGTLLKQADNMMRKGLDKLPLDVKNRECIERYAFFTRYVYSCLTDADFLDTESFCSGGLERGLTGDFSAALDRVNSKLASMQNDTDVRRARNELQQQAFSAGLGSKVGILNMPTGSGKTLCSIKLALERAVKSRKKRIIYVIPYTSIIEQTADNFQKLFGDVLPILQHHSNFDFDDMKPDDEMSAERIARTTENWDTPLVITTNVQFFQSIYHNRSSKLRKLHNLADSVIVFDEVHMMPVDYLQPCLRGVGYLVNFLSCDALFLSATMPDFSELFKKYAIGCDYGELISNKSGFKFFRNCRCIDIGEVSEEKLLTDAEKHDSSLIIVNSRKRARDLYTKCSAKNKFCLSTYMTPNDRSAAIESIRNLIGEESVTVISTSLIEAGVDLDFEAVYRELSGIDSVIQSAGRCNREGKRPEGYMHVFTLEGVSIPRGMKMQAGITQSLMKEYDDIFSPECIEDYYKRLYGAENSSIENGTIYKPGMRPNTIPFRDYAEGFNMIDSDTINVIIPNEDNRDLVDSLKYSAKSLRKLSRYSATLHYNEFRDLLGRGIIESVGAAFVLACADYYSSETGLNPDYEQNTVL